MRRYRSNTILYCRRWRESVDFYRRVLRLHSAFANDWFVEFELGPSAFLSIADAARASIAPAEGAGITLSLQVADLREVWEEVAERGGSPGPVRRHAWGARVFYLWDPEGHRIEFWQAEMKEEEKRPCE